MQSRTSPPYVHSADVVSLVTVTQLDGLVDTSGSTRGHGRTEAACERTRQLMFCHLNNTTKKHTPFSVKRSTSTVGLPRESKIYRVGDDERQYHGWPARQRHTWRAWILVIDMVERGMGGRRGRGSDAHLKSSLNLSFSHADYLHSGSQLARVLRCSAARPYSVRISKRKSGIVFTARSGLAAAKSIVQNRSKH